MSEYYSIAFYNLENLIDPGESHKIFDPDYSANGKLNWSKEKYLQKIENISKVISRIGKNHSKLPPVLAGVCEIGHESCLKDLIASDHLKPYDYDYVFHQSQDSRGMNVALLFQKSFFKLSKKRAFPLPDPGLENDKSRDILMISGDLYGNKIHILINHWPSRTEGTRKTNPKRLLANAVVKTILNQISKNESSQNIIIMGDFNDGPDSQSVRNLVENDFINPISQWQRPKSGTVRFKGKWMIFDQILISRSFKNENWIQFESAHIFIEPYLIQKSGRYKGYPKRTFNGSYHQNGYSDHFPVFLFFRRT
ncbi:endonuclease [Lutimonas saemankumensis]|uniref:endonuclease/exonuclease/phosphatase family protein n=1 Tax=Lutimonas saemankumensis TaxID=483016 RepID=UPI001CD5B448|nr:endonuclease/exonuclease/phosphatase family protein [Lutimonas saemankumensis]MCA0933038.1 endonuclease [Lutimonas saemankumensis]